MLHQQMPRVTTRQQEGSNGVKADARNTSAAQDKVATAHQYKTMCGPCHGMDGKGATEQGRRMGIADISSLEWQKKVSDQQIRAAISNGVKRVVAGKQQQMDPYRDRLRASEIEALAVFVRSLSR